MKVSYKTFIFLFLFLFFILGCTKKVESDNIKNVVEVATPVDEDVNDLSSEVESAGDMELEDDIEDDLALFEDL